MTDERKKTLIIAGAVAVGALILLAFFRSGKVQTIQPIVPDGSMGTLGLVNPGPVGSGITYNIPPYVPPNQAPVNYNIGSTPSIPPPAPSGCCNQCEGPMYVASESILLQSAPAPVLQWYQNVAPPPPPEPQPVWMLGRNALAASIESQRQLIQDMFGYGSTSTASGWVY